MDYSQSKLKIFIQYIKPHSRLFVIDMTLSLMVALIDLVFPIISRWSMQRLLPSGLYQVFFAVMGIILFTYVLRGIFTYLVTVVGHKMGTSVEADMREDIFNHMQRLSFSYYDENRTGVLLGRITNDLFEIVELSHHGPENILTCSVTIIGAIVILMSINWRLGLLILILAILCIFASARLRLDMLSKNKQVKVVTGEINASIESSLSGIRVSKAFGNEMLERQKFAKVNNQFRQAKVNYYKSMGAFNSSVELTVGVMQVAVITLGGFMIMHSTLDYIDLITFTLYVSIFTMPVRKLAQFMEIFSQGSAGYERFLEVMRTEPEICDTNKAVAIDHVLGDIKFRHVSFTYPDGSLALDDVSFHVRQGETIALVGESGGGKTTISNLIPRFYDVSSGSILIDDIDVRQIKQSTLRKAIGVIQQDVFLFAGSIADNIRYGKPDASDAEVREAAALAKIHEDILKMPAGYDTYVGERGVKLSGGQKQRISIARVFLRNPQILILDEATSALDSVTESEIQLSLEQLSQGRTTIMIAHRLSTVRSADRIAVISNGRILEIGSRDELLAKNSYFVRLEKAQHLN